MPRVGRARQGVGGADRFPELAGSASPPASGSQRMHPGHVAIESVEGRAAHSSRPDLGANAIEAAAAVALVARDLAERSRPGTDVALPEMDRPWVTLNVAEIHGGRAINIVPDACTVRIGYRPLPGQDRGRCSTSSSRGSTALGTPHPGEGPDPARSRRRCSRPTVRPPAGPRRARCTTTDAARPPSRPTAATSRSSGCSRWCSGPGSIRRCHQADEYVPTADLVRAVDVVEAVVRSRCTT